jgi:sugar lactone lactonase YvrE
MRRLLGLMALLVIVGCGKDDEKKDGGRADVLALPGDTYYPESLAIDADGALFVGSLATGQVVRFAPDSDEAEIFVGPGGALRGTTGVLVNGASLYACDVDLGFASNSRVVRFDLATGATSGAFALSSFGFANDLTFDGSGNLYVADSFGAVHVLPSGASAMEPWSNAPELAPTAAGAFGADGIVWDGGSNLYVNTFTDGRLFRIPILGNGSAGTLVEIQVTPALQFPDAMRNIDANTLLVVEGAGNLTRVAITGTSGNGDRDRTGCADLRRFRR